MKRATTRDLTLMALFAALIAVGAFIRIPSPLVPITLQLLFTTLAGMLLGGKRGAVSVLCYIILGLMGMPVFTGGGGLAYVVQPTFGYLIGFCVGAYVTGILSNRTPTPSIGRLMLAGVAGLMIVYALGIVYYWLIYRFYIGTGVGLWSMLLYCFLLPLPGDLALMFAAAVLGKRLIPVLRRERA